MIKNDRLYAFFHTDEKALWRAYLWSIAIGTLAGVVTLAFNLGPRMGALITCAVSCVTLSGFAYFYKEPHK